MLREMLICFLLIPFFSFAQQNRIKIGLIGVPFQSGFVLADVGFERLNKERKASWQLHYNYANGSVAADAGDTKREWFTAERSFYTGKKGNLKLVYSFFMEAGNRTKFPGYIHPPPDSVPKYTRKFELCPGAAAGLHFNYKKHLGLQLLTGPKLIFVTKEITHYKNINTKQEYQENKGSSLKPGFRFMLNLCYTFK